MYNYLEDNYGRLCLQMAFRCRTEVGFGAVLVDKTGQIIGIGRNRLATQEDRDLIPRVDYCIHAEQDAIAYALRLGMDVKDASVYVLGLCLSGKNRGALTVREEDIFICKKCPHVFLKYNIKVFIPHVEGWHSIEPAKALEIGRSLADKGYWKEFANG
jgi:hypothetical protein